MSELVTGEPHVFWAGTTDDGRVAVVMQAMKTQETETPPAVGVVAVDPYSGQLAVLVADAPGPLAPDIEAPAVARD